MINLYTSFYDEKNKERKVELHYCLKMNVENVLIDCIYVLVESGVSTIKNSKIKYIPCEGRPTFKMFFDLINHVSSEEDINVITNSDIYFDDSISFVGSVRWKTDCYALSRWEINSDGSKGNQVQTRGDSQDVWIIKGTLRAFGYCEFPLAKLGCDNRIAWEFKEAGYEVTNPSKHIRAWHNHSSQIRNYDEVNRDCVPLPYLVQIMPSYLDNISIDWSLPKNEPQPREIAIDRNKLKLLHVGLSATGEPLNGLQKAFMKHFIYEEIYTGTPNLNEAMISKVETFKPDIVFIQIQTDGYIWEQTIIDIKKTGAFIMNFTGDVRYPIPAWYYGLGKHLDLTLFSNMTDVEKMILDGYRSDYLELGIDPEIYKPKGEFILSHPIVFMGNHYGNFPLSNTRYEMVKFMTKKYGHKFGVYGNGWPLDATVKVSGNYNDSQKNEASIYRASKIAINISHFDYKRYSSDRLLRIMGTGVFCLCKKYEDMPFEDGVHLRTWETFSQLEGLCEYYLKNINERLAIAKAGCDFVHANFIFESMIKNIKKLYDKHR